jgi:hypothetical protein
LALPGANHPVWANILQGARPFEFEFIGAKMLVVRLRLVLKQNPAALAQACAEFHNLLEKNLSLPSVQRDLQKLAL